MLPLSRKVGSHDAWRGAAEDLIKPLAALMQSGKADLPMEGQASNHDSQADRLESFARPCLLAARELDCRRSGPSRAVGCEDMNAISSRALW